jgi:MoaA/NifB/PqqE/SkfB family radical SAM enzyme
MGTREGGRKLALAGRLIRHKFRGQPLRHLTIEVTKRCNARCFFCDYWKEPPQKELEDYSAIVRRFDPLVVTFSGGEPLLREDIVRVVERVRAADPAVYLAMVTNGELLTVDKAKDLRRAGIDQLSISLDYDHDRHGRVRGLPGLYERIVTLLPGLKEAGFDSLSLNTVIKDDNLESIPGILDLAVKEGVMVGFSSYCELKTGNGRPMVSPERLGRLAEIIGLIKEYKRRHGVTRTSDYYLDNVIAYFDSREIPGCRAGQSWIQVTPGGEIKPCSELPVVASDFRAYDPASAGPVSCTACWYSCRGESQAPLTPGRIRELL